MEIILTRIEARLDGMSKKLERLELQNEILRKELHGIRSSPRHENSFALMEAKTLREVVEEVQFEVKAINAKLANFEDHQVPETITKKKSGPSSKVDDRENVESTDEESDDEFQTVEIRSKTFEAEQNWMRGKVNEMSAQSVIKNGDSFQGKNIETISNSIPLPNHQNPSTCVLKLSNHLNFPLTDPQFHYWQETKMTGPSVVIGHFSEVYQGSGQSCSFLCSFLIRNSIRLLLDCQNYDESNFFRLAFIPHNLPTDPTLDFQLSAMEATPDISIKYNNGDWSTEPLEFFVTTGGLLARGHMAAAGRRAIVQVDIFEMTQPPLNGPLNSNFLNVASNHKRTLEKMSSSMDRCHTKKKSCSIKIFNLLNVPLRSRETFYCGSEHKIFTPEVPPLQGATFFASDDKNVKGMFSYEIESTDLCLVIAFKAQGQKNYFTGAFLPLPAPTGEQEMKELMGGNHWKSHDWRKTANAKEGEQVLEVRNIRAIISMTEGKKSLLKIQVFAY